MIKQIRQEIEKTEKRNEEMKKALVPCWTEIEQNRGYILGLRYALQLLEQRDCDNCKHHTENGCSSWDCEFEPKDGCDNDHDCEHCDWTECPVEEEPDDE